MSPLRARILAALKGTGDDPAGVGWFYYIDVIAEEAGVTRREARIAVRALTRMGFARLERIFDDGTGLTAGSGYGITLKGAEAAARGDEDAE